MDDRRHILIVDDEESNIDILVSILEKRYEISVAMDGLSAIEHIKKNMPDLILLDVLMPKMNGFEVCTTLKNDPETSHIPVLFISALDQSEYIVKGFKSGGRDYITKPIQCDEVLTRIETHLEVIRKREELERKNRDLEALEVQRDNLIHMIVHDMRSQVQGISGYLELTLMNLEEDSCSIKDYIEHASNSSQELTILINSILDTNRFESGKMPLLKEVCDLRDILDKAIESLGGLIVNIDIRINKPIYPINIYCDTDLIRRVIMNLIGNAIKHTHNGYVQVDMGIISKKAVMSISDNGPGIPKEFHKKIFEKFGQAEISKGNRKFSTGLGLSFCKLAVEAHDGQIGVRSSLGKGSSFWFNIPTTKKTNDKPNS